MAAAGILTSAGGRPAPALIDTLERDGVSGGNSDQLLSLTKNASGWMQRDEVLDFFVSFYRQDAVAWNNARIHITDGSLPLLSPFCQKTYQRLTPEMRSGYFSFVIPAWIVQGQSDPEALMIETKDFVWLLMQYTVRALLAASCVWVMLAAKRQWIGGVCWVAAFSIATMNPTPGVTAMGYWVYPTLLITRSFWLCSTFAVFRFYGYRLHRFDPLQAVLPA